MVERVVGDAVARALKNSPTAGIAAAELRRAGDLVEQARAASIPTLSATGQYGLEGPSALANVGITNTAGQQVSGLYYWYGAAQLTVPILAATSWSAWAHSLNDQTTAKWTESTDYYLGTTVQPDASTETTEGAKLIEGSFTPEAKG